MVVNLSLDIVLRVGYIITPFEPANAFSLESFFGPDARLHSNLIQTCGLCQIEDIEFNLVSLLICAQSDVSIDDFEVVPLGMAFGVEVILKPEVILNIIHFGSFPQITVLESWIKN